MKLLYQKEDSKIQDIITCIKDGERVSTPIGKGFGKRKGLANDHYYVQNPEELKKLFVSFLMLLKLTQNFYKNLNLIL
jgi:DNA polymerase-3 subunit alpha